MNPCPRNMRRGTGHRDLTDARKAPGISEISNVGTARGLDKRNFRKVLI